MHQCSHASAPSGKPCPHLLHLSLLQPCAPATCIGAAATIRAQLWVARGCCGSRSRGTVQPRALDTPCVLRSRACCMLSSLPLSVMRSSRTQPTPHLPHMMLRHFTIYCTSLRTHERSNSPTQIKSMGQHELHWQRAPPTTPLPQQLHRPPPPPPPPPPRPVHPAVGTGVHTAGAQTGATRSSACPPRPIGRQ